MIKELLITEVVKHLSFFTKAIIAIGTVAKHIIDVPTETLYFIAYDGAIFGKLASLINPTTAAESKKARTCRT